MTKEEAEEIYRNFKNGQQMALRHPEFEGLIRVYKAHGIFCFERGGRGQAFDDHDTPNFAERMFEALADLRWEPAHLTRQWVRRVIEAMQVGDKIRLSRKQPGGWWISIVIERRLNRYWLLTRRPGENSSTLKQLRRVNVPDFYSRMVERGYRLEIIR